MGKHNAIKTVMTDAIKQARDTMNKDLGGPFGAAVIDQDGTILSLASNSVLADHDPTAHAEVNAIRQAAIKKNTHDLTGCTLVTTAYPCPMCLGATIWANIKTIYYGANSKDAEAIGFRDDFIYRFIKGDCEDINVLDIKEYERTACLDLFKEYKDKNKVLY